MKIRIAEYGDINTISCVLAASWKSAYRGIVNDDYLDRLKDDHWVDFLTTGFDNGDHFAMILEDDQHIIVGAAILRGERNIANLISFYLLPEKIGHGFGHALYSGVEDELRNRGFRKCVLDVLGHNKRAILFYKKHGFTSTDEVIKTTLGNGEYFCNVYEKRVR
ncbi:MAG: GNAT family N-acetyltransferase [Oscillospiraceae bacterium]|nr:GNAT family N-acetyltransferase [Oscillospiraceae bacterium]